MRSAACTMVGLGLALLVALPALAEVPPPGKPRPASPVRPAIAAPQRAPTVKPLSRGPSAPGALLQARIEAMCVRYRVIYGMDCPSGNGRGAGGIGVWDEVGRLPLQERAPR